MKVRITTATVGQSFATVGIVKARNGRTIHTTEPRPFGYDHAAFAAAVDWANAHNHDHGYVWVTVPGMHGYWKAVR